MYPHPLTFWRPSFKQSFPFLLNLLNFLPIAYKLCYLFSQLKSLILTLPYQFLQFLSLLSLLLFATKLLRSIVYTHCLQLLFSLSLEFTSARPLPPRLKLFLSRKAVAYSYCQIHRLIRILHPIGPSALFGIVSFKQLLSLALTSL